MVKIVNWVSRCGSYLGLSNGCCELLPSCCFLNINGCLDQPLLVNVSLTFRAVDVPIIP
jgi:hypothetical protein